MFERSLLARTLTAAIAGAIAVSAAAPANAQYYSRLGEVNRQIADREYDSPGSSLIYYACEAAAFSEYRRTERTGDALATLVACAGTGCLLTGDYRNCISVARDLFLLRLERDLLRR
jgi:hypothetical protein